MDIQHTRFAVLFNYIKELYVLAESSRTEQLKQLKEKYPEIELKEPHFEKEERFSHPDELKKRTLTDFKRKVISERVRKLQLQIGEDLRRDRGKANISLIQLLQDQINEMRADPNRMHEELQSEQKFEDDFLDRTRQDLKTTMSDLQNNKEKSFETEKIPFYLKDKNTHSAHLLKKIVHLDLNFKSQLEAAKTEHKLGKSKSPEV